MESLPAWIDLGKIGSLGLVVLFVVQFVKTRIPDKWIQWASVIIGIFVGLLDCYMSGGVTLNLYVKAGIFGLLAGISAVVGFDFLGNKGGRFSFPSKADLTSVKP